MTAFPTGPRGHAIIFPIGQHHIIMDSLFKKKDLRVTVVGRNLDDIVPLIRLHPVALVEEEPDLVISHGGDGSLLGAELCFPGIPKCPIRDRRQNPKCQKHSEMTTLAKLFNGELKKSYLEKLEAVTENGDRLCALNDIVLTRQLASSAVRYRIWIDGELFRGQVVADGLVVTTPFGSTGYYQSITRGNIRTGIGLAFNNAMDLLGHTVIHGEARLTIQLLRGPAVMVADNNPRHIELDTGAMIQVYVLPERTPVYGVDVFRCLECYHLRKDGVVDACACARP